MSHLLQKHKTFQQYLQSSFNNTMLMLMWQVLAIGSRENASHAILLRIEPGLVAQVHHATTTPIPLPSLEAAALPSMRLLDPNT